MDKPFRSAACLSLAALLMAACTSDGKPYARESQRRATAAEQMSGNMAGTPPGTATVAAERAPQPTTMAPSRPETVPQPAAMIAPTDAAFAQKVAASFAAEIELSRITYIKAHSPEVRAFARQLLIEHRELAIDLDNFALERGYLVVWRIEPEMASTIGRLRTLDGPAFDGAYMDVMVDAHSKSVATLETQAASARETASLANASLPTVRHHLEMARALDPKV